MFPGGDKGSERMVTLNTHQHGEGLKSGVTKGRGEVGGRLPGEVGYGQHWHLTEMEGRTESCR